MRILRHIPGWRRVVDLLASPTHSEFAVENRGAWFAGNLSSFIDREIYLFGRYEDRQIAHFLVAIPEDRRGVILDIGANTGNHSVAFAQVFKTVHAFEPNPLLWDNSSKILNSTD